MLDVYSQIQARVTPGMKLRTPDEKVGSPFVVEKVDEEGVEVKTHRGGRIRISLFTFEMAVKFLDDRGHRGESWIEVKDQDFQTLLDMENDRVRAASYILAILGAAGVIDVDGRRPNRVRLSG